MSLFQSLLLVEILPYSGLLKCAILLIPPNYYCTLLFFNISANVAGQN